MNEASKKKSYHHGDLRRAILDAAEAELADRGLDAFSLRRVAARVGVSHTAPSHHFGDANGLIAALAERGFRRLLECMKDRQQGAAHTPYEQLVASGLGYLEFAQSHPALFRLVFGWQKGKTDCDDVMVAAEAAFMHLARDVAALHGAEPLVHPGAREQVLACWTRAHGFAELMLAGLVDLPNGPDTSARDALFRDVFAAQFKPD
jgi:AcrR family transcriptional regulator